MAEIHGTCDPRFAELRDVLSGSIDSGADLGASVAVILDDEPVVDVWGGWADEARTRPWEEHTVTNVWSTTKTVVALAALLLVERGQLDVFAPVADYWPEFAQNGKERIEVRHLLVPHVGGVRLGAAGDDRRHLRLGAGDRDPRGPAAVVGAGHRVRLPPRQLRPPRRRGDPPGRRPEPAPVRGRGARRAVRRRLPDRVAARGRAPGLGRGHRPVRRLPGARRHRPHARPRPYVHRPGAPGAAR